MRVNGVICKQTNSLSKIGIKAFSLEIYTRPIFVTSEVGFQALKCGTLLQFQIWFIFLHLLLNLSNSVFLSEIWDLFQNNDQMFSFLSLSSLPSPPVGPKRLAFEQDIERGNTDGLGDCHSK